MQTYADAFARHGVTVGQVLLTADDVVRIHKSGKIASLISAL